MSDTYNHHLAAVAAEAFSTLGFIFPTGEPDPALEVDAPGAVSATVGFAGPISGAVDLCVSADLLPVLAANMSGSDEPPPEDQQADALGEMLNIICGNVLPLLDDPASVYDVAAPQSCSDVPDHAGLKAIGAVGLPMDAGVIHLILLVDEAADMA